MLGRVWGIRHLHWFYLATRWEWWVHRQGKDRLPPHRERLIEQYLQEVWQGEPHA